MLTLTLAAFPAWSQEPVPPEIESPEGAWMAHLLDSLQEGDLDLTLRYRFEFSDDEAFEKKAYASTLRTMLGYQTSWYDFTGRLEFENISALGNDIYQSTLNGETDRAVVPDPESTEVNQVFVRYDGWENVTPTLGRQILLLDNQRFVGPVGWRQNYQTYDAVRMDARPAEDIDLFYAYLDNVNRIFGDDSPVGDARMSSHLFNGSWNTGLGKWTAYWYYLDTDAFAAFSTSTVGARWAGDFDATEDWGVGGTAEYAVQRDVEDNPADVDANYAFGELAAAHRGTRFALGYELLEGSGAPGDKFSTPLATLHAFNGWADQFLITPDTGLEDLYASISGSVQDYRWSLIWHDFRSDSGSLDYGSELDALVTRKVSERVRVGLKLASYSADDFAQDTFKLWTWVELAL